jgi:S-adenosylmethionine decarboxylase
MKVSPHHEPRDAAPARDPSDPCLHGREWIVDAQGCDPARLASLDALTVLFDRLVDELRLTPVGPPAWHRFPGAGGITGMVLLAESHLACHTFPEFGSICLNVFCCRARPAWDFSSGLAELLGATRVTVREVDRDYARDGRAWRREERRPCGTAADAGART